jgi:CubicO group peptidase (beta-lactamase class C family)
MRHIWMLVFLSALQPAVLPAAPATDLTGLWSAKRTFGPFPPTRLIVTQDSGGYRADMLGRSVPVKVSQRELSFSLSGDLGSFRGRLDKGGQIIGFWFRGGTPPNMGHYASPVSLKKDGKARWSGIVITLQDQFSFFLLLKAQGPGSWTSVLRNPERDFGGQLKVTRLVREGNGLKLLGTRTGKEEPIALGTFDTEREAILLNFPDRGGSYDFTRDGDESEFYPRGKNPTPYVYHQPPALDDGWPTASLEQVDIDRPAMERFIERLIEIPQDSEDAPQYHGFLLARHGKLVLEEYFHGHGRERLHDTRSAAKSMTSVLAGAVMKDGAPLRLDSPVYQTMSGGSFPADLDPEKRSMTLEHLLTMSSGYFCDDTNENAPGNEDRMSDQSEEPDYYKYILKVPMATPPGDNSVYCSAVANLALGLVGAALKDFPIYAFDRLIAKPMRLGPYAWALDPAGNPFGGGSVQFLPRDFIKFGQLLVNGGRWDGKQILAPEFAKASISPLYHLRKITYGYLWWVEDLPYKDRTVRAFMALGAGGQLVMGIPELDLVIGIHAGNYATRTQGKLREVIPRYVLPAVREPGDDKNASVIEREYTNPYGASPDGSRVKP